MSLRLDAAEPSDAGVVHEYVEPVLPPDGLVDERGHGQMVAHVGRERQHARALRRHPGQLGFRLFEMVFVEAGDRDVNARCRSAAETASPMPREPPVTIATFPSRDAMAKLYDSREEPCQRVSPVLQSIRAALSQLCCDSARARRGDATRPPRHLQGNS